MENHDIIASALSRARQALAVLETQAAGYTALTIPAHLVIELDEKRKEVTRLEAQIRAAASGAPGLGLPHNLPRRGEFVGREATKARVHEALRSRSYLVSIEGIGGIGKTSLALEVAYECLQPGEGTARFDGVIWASARDRSPNLDDVLDAVARTLDCPGIAQKPLEEKREGVVRLLRSGAYLLLVDNFETIADAAVGEFLQDLPEPSKALVTTRERKLERAWTIPLKGLEEAEALALIRAEGRRIGMPGLERAEDAVLLPLYTATGGAPLALKWAVGQIKQPGQSLKTVLAALHEAQGNLFDHMFARSWGMLTPEAQRVLMALSLFDVSASWEATEAVSEVQHFALDEALRQLVQMSLVDVTDELEMRQRRLRLHPLTRSFSGARSCGLPEAGSLMKRRFIEYFHAYVHRYGGHWSQEGFDELDREFPNLAAMLDADFEAHFFDEIIGIFIKINDFLVIRGYWNMALDFGNRFIEKATDLGKLHKAARVRLWPMSWVHRHQGYLDEARLEASQALEYFESQNDIRYIHFAKRHLGRIAQERGDLEQAQVLLTEALHYFQDNGVSREIIMTVVNLAEIALKKGLLDEAKSLCLSQLDVARQFDDPERLATVYFTLGQIENDQGDFEKSTAYLEDSLSCMRKAKRPDGVAGCLLALGKSAIAAGKLDSVMGDLVEARRVYVQLDVAERVSEIDQIISSLSSIAVDPGRVQGDI